jgi:hypothetical protein
VILRLRRMICRVIALALAASSAAHAQEVT